MNLIFINRFFHPDEVATSLMLSDLAFALAKQGRHVTVITSRLNHGDSAIQYPPHENLNGVCIYRVWTSRFGRSNLLGRAFDYLSFYFSAFLCLLQIVSKGDIVVAKTDPPIVSVIAQLACRHKGAKQLNWLQDVFPEAVVALGMRLPTPALKLLTALRNWSVRNAHMNVVLGERMRERLLTDISGLKPEQLVVIPNWSRDDEVRPVAADQNPLRAQWGLENAFVVGYSGNLGRAHEFQTFLQAAAAIQNAAAFADVSARIRFLFIGSGAGLAEVKAGVEQMQLSNVLFKPFQPASQLAFSLSVPDLHLVSLLPSAEGLIVPSKYYGVAAAGRACAFVGDPDGELGRILSFCDGGQSFAIGEAGRLAAFIANLARNPDMCGQMGLRARQWLDANGGFETALAKWQACLNRVENSQ